MKNNIIKLALLFLTGTTSLSCMKYLEENPPTSFTDATVFRDAAGCEAAMIGCYSGMTNSGLWQGNMFEWLGYASSLLHWKTDRSNDPNFTGMFEQAFSPTYELATQLDQMYPAINNCNVLIERIALSGVSEQIRRELSGEAHLLRAIMYFTLVRLYGDMPLVTVQPKTMKEAEIGRTASNIVYKQIIDDLNVAWNWMRDEARQAEVSGTTGRPHKWAAKAFLAKVYVQIGSIMSYPNDQPKSFTDVDFSICGIESAAHAWQLALETAEDVIKNSPYRLADNYSDLFRWRYPSDFQLKERIFVLQATMNGTYGNNVCAYRTLPRYVVGSAEGAAIAWNNENYGRVRPSRYIFQRWAKTHGGVIKHGRKDELTDVYEDCPDPRFDASMFHTSYEEYRDGRKDKIRVINMYPRDGYVNNMLITGDACSVTGIPFLKKYLDPKFNDTRGYADFYMLRLADIYLLAAEAAAELSNAPGDEMWNKAFEHIETIHSRARNSSTTPVNHPKWTTNQFTSKEELVSALMYERFFELLGEGHEWFDIRRKGAKFMIDNLNKPLNQFNLQESEGRNSNAVATAKSGAYEVLYMKRVYSEDVEKVRLRLLNALTQAFINSNSALDPIKDQNPGW